jgi:hypothetical protein
VTILAFGGEMGFFIPSDSAAIEGQVLTYNASFARGYSGANGAASYLETPSVSAQADFWLHFDIDQEGTINSSTKERTVELLDNGGIGQIRLAVNWLSGGADASWEIQTFDGALWNGVGSFNAAPGTMQTVDIHVVSNTASGSINVYLSGTHRIDSGTINLSGFTGIAKARCYGLTHSIAERCGYSQMILATESTIGKRVGTIVMTGQGSTHTFTTGGFGNIDELAYSDADVINSDTNAQVELFTGTPVPSFTSYVIRALAICARVKKESTGIAQVQLALRSAGTTYFSATKSLDFAYGNICNMRIRLARP